MLRSMYAGISGMRTHQTMMDVVGNNIANVNTVGFKAGTTVFQDVLSQTVRNETAPVPGRGGTNPAQVGLGVQLGGIGTNLTQGSSQLTGRTTDLAIQGDGYFSVDQGGEVLYTRGGSFSLDADGQLVTATGGLLRSVEGGPIVVPNDGTVESFGIGSDGTVRVVLADGSGTAVVGQIALSTFANPAGLAKLGGSLLRPTGNSGAPLTGAPGEQGRGRLDGGVLEMSNVDLAQEFTNLIVAQRGFQANSRIISASDELLQDLVNLKR